ncbi:uncharacterized protein F5891DRAFT_987272 [Suillus fuscotomentosus]|uniref:Uncharacterized protein n=1 Tax=Suillus fuscotomentosus TaxID=1912939 RepID=A0AAD4DRX8_9AGAM|nr:uncharacterized protein F5891DRAFT_987272 [Suillus fuscotomentosus]KAG1889739.1 hypothetical protein F5891DRAFT_987272 [Suillus fuscotomentosus]
MTMTYICAATLALSIDFQRFLLLKFMGFPFYSPNAIVCQWPYCTDARAETWLTRQKSFNACHAMLWAEVRQTGSAWQMAEFCGQNPAEYQTTGGNCKEWSAARDGSRYESWPSSYSVLHPQRYHSRSPQKIPYHLAQKMCFSFIAIVAALTASMHARFVNLAINRMTHLRALGWSLIYEGHVRTSYSWFTELQVEFEGLSKVQQSSS